MRSAIEAGDRVYDFTIGDHPYKLQFGAETVPLDEWHQARTLRGHAAVLSDRARARGEAHAQAAARQLRKSVRELRSNRPQRA